MKKNMLIIAFAFIANFLYASENAPEGLFSGCTISSTKSYTETVLCEGGGQVSESFTAECEMTDEDCYWAQINADACALGRATMAGFRARTRLATLCGPSTGPEGPGGN